MKLAFLVSSLAVGGVSATTPISAVIKLITDLEQQNIDALKTEETGYKTFSCFCKDKSDERAKFITDGTAEIETQAAELGQQQQTYKQETKKHADAKAAKAAEEATKAAEQARRSAELAKQDEKKLDLDNANTALANAISSVTAAQPVSLVEQRAVLHRQLVTASALGLQPAHYGKGKFATHSNDVVDILNELQEDFTKQSTDHTDLMRTTRLAHEGAIKGHNDEIAAQQQAQDNAQTAFEAAQVAIGKAREALVQERTALEGNETYLKDLTGSCELRARTWDQRKAMRQNEITALGAALSVLKDSAGVQGTGASKGNATRRALVQDAAVVQRHAVTVSEEAAPASSFLQRRALNLRARRVEAAAATLEQSADQLSSAALLQASAELKLLTSSPFDKVKTLIQKLIERLTREATAEATHEGWCNTETAKATKERDYRKGDVESLNAELAQDQADRDENLAKIDELSTLIKDTTDALNEASDLRSDDKEDNLKTISDAREGRDAVKEAIVVLKNFYKGENKAGGAVDATVSFAQLAQDPERFATGSEAGGAGGIVEDEQNLTDIEFQGGEAYTGNQTGADGILTMLSQIQEDFARTLDQVRSAEKTAAAEHVKFSRESSVTIAGSEQDKKNRSDHVDQLKAAIESGFSDLTANVDLMDSAVRQLQKLNKCCVDTGMTFEERSNKRKEEIAALRTAMTQLAPKP